MWQDLDVDELCQQLEVHRQKLENSLRSVLSNLFGTEVAIPQRAAEFTARIRNVQPQVIKANTGSA
jgi:hypothetical protein